MTLHSRFLKAIACAGALTFFAGPALAVSDMVLVRELDTRSDVTCSSETAFGNFVTDALRKIHGADIGLITCTTIRGNHTYASGTTFDPTAVAAEIAPDAKMVMVEVTGMQLLDALEQAMATAPAMSTIFPQISGVRMVVDPKKPVGQRVVKLTSNAVALDFARTYKLATTEDTLKAFPSLASAKRVEGQGAAVADDVSAHLQNVGVKDIKVLGRIKFVQ